MGATYTIRPFAGRLSGQCQTWVVEDVRSRPLVSATSGRHSLGKRAGATRARPCEQSWSWLYRVPVCFGAYAAYRS
jgi:hypothetical protein